MIYLPKTEPFPHQRRELERSQSMSGYGALWEMGTGKTKLDIDDTALAFEDHQIEAALVVAPDGVHSNWISDEIPAHLPDRIDRWCFEWNSRKARNVSFQSAFRRFMAAPKNVLPVLAVSYDAFTTDVGRKALRAFLEAKRCKLTADESHFIKTPDAKRTKLVVNAGRKTVRRRILSGTPVPNSPFDIYSQIKFLDPDFWERHGIGSFTAFRSEFGVYQVGHASGGCEFPQLVAFRNVPRIYDMIQPITSRVMKDDVLTLPPKLYSKRYVEMLPNQQRIYDQLRDELYADIGDGSHVSAQLAIVKMLRLQQVACGYVPADDDGEPRLLCIEGENPLIKELNDVLDEAGNQQTIIWHRFRMDGEQISETLRKRGDTFVRYDGSIPHDVRELGKRSFQEGSAQRFVGNPAAGGRGLTLLGGTVTAYYSNSFNLEQRLQSEDRPHRIGQTKSCLYVDFVIRDTVIERTVTALRKKRDISALVTGDTLKEWI